MPSKVLQRPGYGGGQVQGSRSVVSPGSIHINQFLNIKFQQYVSLETLPVFVFVFLNGAVEFFLLLLKLQRHSMLVIK